MDAMEEQRRLVRLHPISGPAPESQTFCGVERKNFGWEIPWSSSTGSDFVQIVQLKEIFVEGNSAGMGIFSHGRKSPPVSHARAAIRKCLH